MTELGHVQDMTEPRPKVVYWVNLTTPYMVDRWNAVVDSGQVDLEVWFSWKSSPNRGWQFDETTWKFAYRYLPNLRILGKSIPVPLPLLRRPKPDAVISFYAAPWFLVGWAISKLRRIRTGFWAEPTSDSWVNRTAFKEAFKRWLFPKVDGMITTGPTGRAFCRRYNVEDRRIHEAPFGIDVGAFHERALERRPHRNAIRSALGVKGTTFLYVGRLLHGKGLDTLLDAYAMLRRRRNDVSLLIVGQGEEENNIRNRCRDDGIKDVVIESFRQRDDLPDVFVASDVFVFPTLGDTYGLVVDEAMASELPVIASTAAGEIEVRVEPGVNGYLVAPGDADGFFGAMLTFAENPALSRSMGVESWPRICHNTPAAFAKNFDAAISAILAK